MMDCGQRTVLHSRGYIDLSSAAKADSFAAARLSPPGNYFEDMDRRFLQAFLQHISSTRQSTVQLVAMLLLGNTWFYGDAGGSFKVDT